jgi:hypothetical protein
MDSLLIQYSLDPSKFKEIISETGSLVAGSFALAGYLKQEGVEAGYEPGDMDIFICNDNICRHCGFPHTNDRQSDTAKIIQLFSYLESCGYKDTKKFDTFGIVSEDDYYNELANISKVTSLINKDGKEIQIVCVYDSDILSYIKEEFDLSACVSWWDVDTNTFCTMNPEMTKNKQISINGKRPNDKTLGRIEKYKLRGFTILEPPCPARSIPDAKIDIEKLDGLEASDIINLEEVNVKDYLMASDWHMIIKISEKLYAFHRKDLDDAMKTKFAYNKQYEDKFYETPFKQWISEKAYNLMRNSDYSIFELIAPQTVTYSYNDYLSLTVYTVNCYTVQNFINKTISRIFIPKRVKNTNLILEAIETRFNELIETHINQVDPYNITEFQSIFANLSISYNMS